MLPSADTSAIMEKKKIKIEPVNMDKHETKDKCASINSDSQYTSSKNTLDDNTMEELTTECADCTTKPAVSPHKTTKPQHTTTKLRSMATETPKEAVSLLGMPLEILFMIFDHVTSRDDDRVPDYLIRFKYTDRHSSGLDLGDIVIAQPALLMVCKPLRSALSHRFYSSCSFHAKFTSTMLIMSAASGLAIQAIDNKLPDPLKLNTINLTLEICSLSSGMFSPSILVELGKRLFADYQTMEPSSDTEVKLIDLRWRLLWTGDAFTMGYNNDFLNEDLQVLLDEIHRLAANSASLGKYSLQEFGSWLGTWLEEVGHFTEPTYRGKAILKHLA